MAVVYKGVGNVIARMVGTDSVMDEVAAELRTEVAAGWTARADTGAIASSIRVQKIPGERGVTDRLVYSDAPGVLSAEFGHVAGSRRGDRQGPRRWVKGLHIFGKVAGVGQ